MNKVLIIEDVDSILIGIQTVLDKKFNFEIEQVHSFDNAYLKILKAHKDNAPYDLLISDISFNVDEFLAQKIICIEDLIIAFRKIQPSLKIIIYTNNKNPYILKKLKDQYLVNGIIIKTKESLPQLCNAIRYTSDNQNFFSNKVENTIKKNQSLSINTYDINVLKLLSKGHTQHEISILFKEQGIKPSSVSAIEKRIGEIKMMLKANNSIHMISIAKDMYVI